ncbi:MULTISPECIES: helix-turn-helix transcriptional regulator [unclassified Lysobacter]|uniref:helix-turn-helix domain-containing protein n=1 Tax=unclassified Lysobacter TaxID=2635362 RepID=UPI001BE8EA48|nr:MULTISPECIES: helix-turn-helix transcriptional regulator [unclassified Lysobacter]MBT2746207.1 helix-turn-helix transcriptional regulator [Lysobacter sp. ISL-42]MBT2750752.1 helix-turn-helix transcriptional regulator [Lysobacter sp. ISL-50]MBT2776101.1 helix-turn-helix transcriptional regulator [Lysobacter sp. ISL-54]MBT2784607.1 helix-turn-helix transcriptional regulator [Lysobacter sp. ISL-52]
MPNIATIFKAEVARLTRKELKLQVEPLRKQLTEQRKIIAALRADVAKLQKGASKSQKAVSVQHIDDAPATRARFSASGLLKLRTRLGLSREAFAPLLGASPQALVNWETGVNRPRAEFIEKLTIVRGLSKRKVQELLEQHAPKNNPKTNRKATASKRLTKKVSTKRTSPKNYAKKAQKKAANPATPARRGRPAKGSVQTPATAQAQTT